AYFVASVWLMAAFPLLWVAWAFLFRGGLSLRIAGLALVRVSGKPALRLQCAWRAFLVWLPPVALIVLGVWIDAYRPDLIWLCSFLQALAAAVLAAYVALALCFPQRGLHDCLSGLHLVPR